MFKYYTNLGFNDPYYTISNGIIEIKKTFHEIIEKITQDPIIDPVATLEFLNKGYILGDRTLVQGVYKTPWQAKPNEELNNWDFAAVPRHGNLDLPEEEIARILFEKICNEIKLYIGNKNKVGILLSGGMDSRMVAGALDYLIKTKALQNIEVTALTWGNEGSRDVVYAQMISERLEWKWKHYIVTVDDLINNIKETAIHGCEYSPIHLHAIPQMRNDNQDIEVFLAGSYGDSVGRAEYSGKNVKCLKPLDHGIYNVGKFVYKKVYTQSLNQIRQDIEIYHKLFPERKSYMQNELDYQLHYMRRMLNPCMKLLNENSEFYQVFTHPDVFGFMWSIKPERRNNKVYKEMMRLFKTKLDDIPWSRTGIPFEENEGTPDTFTKNHHNYSQQINEILFKKIDKQQFLYELNSLGIINTKAIDVWLSIFQQHKTTNLFYLDKLLWFISLAYMCRIYNIKGIDKYPNKENSFIKLSIIFEYLKNNATSNIKSFIKDQLKG